MSAFGYRYNLGLKGRNLIRNFVKANSDLIRFKLENFVGYLPRTLYILNDAK